jgi:hypothetical protein
LRNRNWWKGDNVEEGVLDCDEKAPVLDGKIPNVLVGEQMNFDHSIWKRIVQMLGQLLGYMIVSPQGRYGMVMPYRVLDIKSIEAIAMDVAEVAEMGGLWLEEG